MPNGWDNKKWSPLDTDFTWITQFFLEGNFLIDIPDDADRYLSLIMYGWFPQNCWVEETNRYAILCVLYWHWKSWRQTIIKIKIYTMARWRNWPESNEMFYFINILFRYKKKENLKLYWSTDGILSTFFLKKSWSVTNFSIFSIPSFMWQRRVCEKGRAKLRPKQKTWDILWFCYKSVCKDVGSTSEFVDSRRVYPLQR